MVNGERTKNSGHFTRTRNAASTPASTERNHSMRASVTHTLTHSYKRRFVGRAIAGLCLLAIVVCIGGIAWSMLGSAATDLAPFAELGITALTLVGAHGFTAWWTLTRRPHWSRWAILHTPYLVMYVMTYIWFFGEFNLTQGGPPSFWYLPWTAAALVSVSWLIVWWLQGDRANLRRAVALFAGLAVFVVVNGAGVLADRWHATNGFGRQGEPDPRAAVDAFLADSCLFTYHSIRKGNKYLPANCPNGTEAASPDLGRVITTEQPREALTPWHQRHQKFQYLPQLANEPLLIEHQNADTATVRLTVTQPVQGEGQDLNAIPVNEFWCLPNGREEVWIIQLETVTLGGWKVTNVEVRNPVLVVPYLGSGCQQDVAQ